MHHSSAEPFATKISPHDSLDQLFDLYCQEQGHAPAYTHCGSTISYTELNTYACYVAAFLQYSKHLQSGDSVAIQLPNIMQFPVMVQAVWKAGLNAVIIDPNDDLLEVSSHWHLADVKAVIMLDDIYNLAERIFALPNIKLVVTTKLSDLHSLPKRMYSRIMARLFRKIVTGKRIKGIVDFRYALLRGSVLPCERLNIKSSSIALAQFYKNVSGQFNLRKYTHANLLSNVYQFDKVFKNELIRPSEIAMTSLPLSHTFAFFLCAVYLPSKAIHQVLIDNTNNLNAVVNEMAKWPFGIYVAGDFAFVSLCKHPLFRQLDLSSLVLTFSGGMPLTDAVKSDWLKITQSEVKQVYGYTDAFPVLSVSCDSHGACSSMGAPLSYTTIQIINHEGMVLPSGEVGQIQVKGPQVFACSTKGQPDDDQGWFSTGDIGYLSDQGELHVLEQKKDIVHVSGFTVYPHEIENVISTHPDIVECAAIGLPEEEGVAIKVFVVTANHQLSVKQVREYCRQRLTSYKVPRLVEFRSYLPKSHLGRVLRHQLLEEELARLYKLKKHI